MRLLTAHRSKGLEWRLVVVAHVQQDGWPDLRRRSTLLQADRIGARRPGAAGHRPASCCWRSAGCSTSPAPAPGSAWSSPPSRRAEDDGEQPSRFLDELGVDGRARSVGRPPRPLSLAGLVAELRRTVADPDTTEPLREAAARRLARLAAESVGERSLVPQADPVDLVGHPGRQPLGRSRCATPTSRCRVSASVLESLMACPTQWFLAREAGGVARAHQSANLGQIVHALAERVATGELAAGPDDVDVLMEHVDAVWDRLDFRTPVVEGPRARPGPRRPSARFLRLAPRQPAHAASAPRRGSPRSSSSPTASRCSSTGYADRLELDADGRVVVVDLKTGRTKPSDKAGRAPRPARRSTSTPSTTAPSTSSCPSAAPRPAVPSWCSSGRSTTAPRPSCSARPPQPEDGARARRLLREPARRRRRRCCAPRSSRRSPASTAATAPSSRSARSRAPGR